MKRKRKEILDKEKNLLGDEEIININYKNKPLVV
jgi:hypothetical protein